MRATKSTLIALSTVTLIALGASPASALQLLSNFGFDVGTASWDACCGGTGTVAWDPTRDNHDSTLSGSARLTHTQAYDGSPTTLFLTRCVVLSGPDVAPGKKLFYGMRARFEPGESTLGKAYVAIEFRTQPDCSGASIGAAAKDLQATGQPRGTWVTIKESPAAGITIPAGTQAVKFFAVITKSSAGTLTVNLDDIYLAPTDTPMCDGLPATQVGTPDYDFINGTAESDVIVGKGGIDWIDGHEGNDRLCGGPGDDVLYGGTGDDRLFGEGGKDTLLGAADDDLLYGAGNNDTLEGGPGQDKLRGGTGVDTCTDDLSSKFKSCEIVPSAS